MYRLIRIVLPTNVSRLLGVSELNLARDMDISVLDDKTVSFWLGWYE